jgi:hypothetical protein
MLTSRLFPAFYGHVNNWRREDRQVGRIAYVAMPNGLASFPDPGI